MVCGGKEMPMDRRERDELRSANEQYRRQAEQWLTAWEEQRAAVTGVVEQLAALRCAARSADGLVTVTVNAGGVVDEVRLEPHAFRQSSPERLGRSITEAAKSAALAVQQQSQQIISPVVSSADDLPDLPDLIPGAPSLKELRDSFTRPLDRAAQAAREPADDAW
jgi:DNA-binding protein YbaB